MADDTGPESLSTKGLPSARRGYDRKAVERLLSEAASAWSELRREHQELVAEIDRAGGLEYLSADLAALAEDVGRMLADARTAAAGIRERANADAEERMRRTAETAGRLQAEAEQVAYTIRRQAWETGTEVLGQAVSTSEAMVEQADADVLVIRAEAEQEAHRRVAAARREASDIVRNARFEADRLVSEAKSLGEELLSRAQQEADAAQERTKALEGRRRRLLEELDEQRSGTAVGSGIRVISTEGSEQPSADPRAHILGDDLAQEVERLQGEARKRALDDRWQTVPDEDVVVDGGWGAPAEPDDESPAHDESPADDEIPAGETDDTPTRETAVVDEAVEEPAPDAAADHEEGRESDVEHPDDAAAIEAGERTDEADEAGAPPDAQTAGESEAVDAEEPAGDDGRLADLFARLRTSSTPEKAASEQTSGPSPEREVDPLEIRDRRLLPVQNQGLREVKHRIVETQNVALDSLRVAGQWSPDPRALAEDLGGALDAAVEAAAEAGAAAAAEMAGSEPPATVLTSRSGEFVAAMVGDLGGRLQGALEHSEGTGPRETSAAVGRVFRGWRVEDAERWVGAVVSAAYHDALLAGLAALGIERVEGVRDGRICDACPAAAGVSWAPGAEPPEGSRRPPANVDCHCTVAPIGG